MGCDRIKMPGGGVAIVCSRGARRMRCFACHISGAYQCDWKLSPTKRCDRYLCPDHAQEVAPEKHLCPGHQEAYRQWRARRADRAATE